MADHVVDTNVLIAASAHDPVSPFPPTGTHVPPAEKLVVFEWLRAFRLDSNRYAVLDLQNRIFVEYRRKLTKDDYGIRAMLEKVQGGRARYVSIEYDTNGDAVLPNNLQKVVTDAADRKIVAAVVADGCQCSIVNACDTDWYDIEEPLQTHGVVVEQLIDGWNREVHRQHLRR